MPAGIAPDIDTESCTLLQSLSLAFTLREPRLPVTEDATKSTKRIFACEICTFRSFE
jgi:hypothetical protein